MGPLFSMANGGGSGANFFDFTGDRDLLPHLSAKDLERIGYMRDLCDSGRMKPVFRDPVFKGVPGEVEYHEADELLRRSDHRPGDGLATPEAKVAYEEAVKYLEGHLYPVLDAYIAMCKSVESALEAADRKRPREEYGAPIERLAAIRKKIGELEREQRLLLG